MTDRTITLRSELVERLESLAAQHGRSLDEIGNDLLSELLDTRAPNQCGSWALAVAEGMEAAGIDWIDDPDASLNSRLT
jgi:predicted transcriptional regulator